MTASFPESILVTGGAGFVGSSLALHLKGRHPRTRIVCLDNLHRRGSELNLSRFQEAGVEFVKGDIRVAGEFPAGPFEFMLECSAEPSVLAGYDRPTDLIGAPASGPARSHSDHQHAGPEAGAPCPRDYLMETNFLGTYRCLEFARQWKSKFLFLSTSRVYPIAVLESHPWVELPTRFAWKDVPGATISSCGVREDCPMTGPRSLYGLTKFASEGLIEEYRAGFGLCAAINRCSVIAGPWQMGKVDQGVVALWVLRHFFGKPLKYLGYGGSGKQVRDALHVADLCELVEEQIANFDRWDGWLGNVGGGLEISVSLRELTAACRQVVGREVPVGADAENRQADLRIFLANCSRLFARTNWRPKRGLTKIVTDIFEWARARERELQPLI